MEVTLISGTNFTVSRGIDGTPAQPHSSGAAFAHAVSARDFKDIQDHVGETTGVHGIANTSLLATINGSQTLTNKTLTSPTINGGVLTTPTIGSFVNAQHTHTDAASGGVISAQWWPPAATMSGTFSPSGSFSEVSSLALSFSSPSSWPSGATRIAYHLHLYLTSPSASGSLVLDVRDNGSSIVPKPNGGFPVSSVPSTQYGAMAQYSWHGSLPSSGSHSVRVYLRYDAGVDITVVGGQFWAYLI
ncbi:hypothetical protein ABZ470_23620 [Streptosporangium sp. NPDC020072]|uniref:hypothetical protein n=1 Tax=Streptosporangium sp. NPDC020072 TaxID=3154788 RepID=UPI0034388C66